MMYKIVCKTQWNWKVVRDPRPGELERPCTWWI